MMATHYTESVMLGDREWRVETCTEGYYCEDKSHPDEPRSGWVPATVYLHRSEDFDSSESLWLCEECFNRRKQSDVY